MKSSIFGIFSFALFFLSNFVVANPIAGASKELEKRFDTPDTILIQLIADVKVVDANWNSTCSSSCTTQHVQSWCQEVANLCNAAIQKCKLIPRDYRFPTPAIIVNLVVELLLEIHFTLRWLLSGCGLLGALISVISLLISVLIIALNALLTELCVFVPNLLSLVAAIIYVVLGLLGCLLCQCGLII